MRGGHDWQSERPRYLIHFSDGGSGMRYRDEQLRMGDELSEGARRYTIEPQDADRVSAPHALAVDSGGNLYAVWSQFPSRDGKDTGDSLLFWSSSKDEGANWSDPVQIPTPGLHNNIQPWGAAAWGT
jgi:hypothetical protein